VLLIAGWWYLRNVQLYGDVTGINAFIDVLGKRAAPASLLQLWGERWGFMLSYWGLFGGVNVPIDYWGYHVLNALAILAVIGVIVYFVTLTWQWFREDPLHSWRDFRHELRDYLQGRAALFLVGLFGVIVHCSHSGHASRGRRRAGWSSRQYRPGRSTSCWGWRQLRRRVLRKRLLRWWACSCSSSRPSRPSRRLRLRMRCLCL
jgi:hypothetical protein